MNLISSINLTNYEKKLIDIISARSGAWTCRPAQVGFAIYNNTGVGVYRKPQGMALRGFKVARSLERKGLIKIDCNLNGEYILSLKKYEQTKTQARSYLFSGN